jgi:hypothetical protein
MPEWGFNEGPGQALSFGRVWETAGFADAAFNVRFVQAEQKKIWVSAFFGILTVPRMSLDQQSSFHLLISISKPLCLQ